jgi:hypothetical protein
MKLWTNQRKKERIIKFYEKLTAYFPFTIYRVSPPMVSLPYRGGGLRAPETLRAMPAVALLLVESLMPDRSRGRSLTKRNILALQVGGWAQGQLLSPGKKLYAKKFQPQGMPD